MFPSTSLRKKARFHGVKLFSWFDVYSVQNPSFREETQIEGLSQNGQYLRELIDAEREVLKNAWGGVEGAEKMVFGGLSQGCAMSLAALLGLDYSLGGWAGMNSFMPMPGTFKEILIASGEISDDGIIFEDDYVARAIGAAEGLRATKSVAATKVVNAFRQDDLSILPCIRMDP